MKLLVQLLVLLCILPKLLSENVGLNSPESVICACVGEILTFTCIVIDASGSGATIWEGSAFECAGEAITLIHPQFIDGTSGECNDQAIVGQSVGVDGECYTSQLNVTISPGLNNKTVACYIDSEMQQEIGTSTIRVADACSEAQPSVDLLEVHPGQLMFSWPQLTSACSIDNVQYVITSQTDCGNCSISATSAKCSDLQLTTTERNCTFSVRSLVRSFAGTPSDPVIVTLRVPVVPKVNLIPVYSDDMQTLIKLIAEISPLMDSFTIYKNISGSVVNYTIHFSSGTIKTIPAIDGVYRYTVQVPPAVCQPSSDVSMISISAANRLGSGLPSKSVSVECTNRLFTVDINPTTFTLTCLFRNSQSSVKTTCGVKYSLCDQEQVFSEERNSSLESPNRVTLQLNLPSGSRCYDYTVTASDGASTVIVEGRIDPDGGDNSSAVVVAAVVVPIIIILAILIVFIGLFIWFCWRRRKNQVMEPVNRHDTNERRDQYYIEIKQH